MLVVVAPGQGAQKSGFLAPWLDEPAVATRLGELSEVAQLDLIAHGTTSDDDTIRDTAIAQPLLVAAGVIASAALFPDAGSSDQPVTDLIAGHSVGEVTAATIAGIFTDHDAMTLVRARSLAMAAASARTPTSMTAIVGGDTDAVLAAIDGAGLSVANRNGNGQIVTGGTIEQLAQLAENPPAGARLFPLSVAGAFHTAHMESALKPLQAVVAELAVADPTVAIVSNADGQVVSSGAEFAAKIVAQVAQQVRWDLCLATMAERQVTGVLELTPAGTLTAIARRNLRHPETNKPVEIFALNTPDQLDQAQDFVAQHRSGPHLGSPALNSANALP